MINILTLIFIDCHVEKPFDTDMSADNSVVNDLRVGNKHKHT